MRGSLKSQGAEKGSGLGPPGPFSVPWLTPVSAKACVRPPHDGILSTPPEHLADEESSRQSPIVTGAGPVTLFRDSVAVRTPCTSLMLFSLGYHHLPGKKGICIFKLRDDKYESPQSLDD